MSDGASVTRDYAVETVVAGFMGDAYPFRKELLRGLQRPFQEAPVLHQFVDEVVTAARANQQQPTQLIGTGLMYGMVLGILVEDERRGRMHGWNYGFSKFDVVTVTKEFLANKYPERREMVANFTGIFRDSAVLRTYVIKLGMVCSSEKLDPNQTAALCMRHGMAVGILLEKDRVQRQGALVN